MYLGTGESYTGGDASGNGIYKSTDGGNNWSLIYGPGASGTVTVTVPRSTRVQGIFYVNDIALYDHDKNGATDPHVFVALGSGSHSKMTATYLDGFEYGLYKSTNGGGTFNRITSINKGSTGASDKDEVNELKFKQFQIEFGLVQNLQFGLETTVEGFGIAMMVPLSLR